MQLGRVPRWVGVLSRYPANVQRRYSAIGGQTLAAGVTLYGFLALLALLVLAVAVLGFVSAGNTDLPREIANDLGLKGDAARIITNAVDAARRSRRLTTVFGLAGLVWLGTSWALSIANVYNAAWGVAARGVRDRPRGLLWLLGAVALFATAGLATAGWALLPGTFAPLVVVVSVTANTAFWIWTSWLLPNRSVELRTVLGPALLGGLTLEVLKVAGGYVVPHYVKTSSELYGVLGSVIALLLWLLVFGRVVVYLAVVEALDGSDPAPDGATSSRGP